MTVSVKLIEILCFSTGTTYRRRPRAVSCWTDTSARNRSSWRLGATGRGTSFVNVSHVWRVLRRSHSKALRRQNSGMGRMVEMTVQWMAYGVAKWSCIIDVLQGTSRVNTLQQCFEPVHIRTMQINDVSTWLSASVTALVAADYCLRFPRGRENPGNWKKITESTNNRYFLRLPVGLPRIFTRSFWSRKL